jgi:L-fucose isomerase-like protein
MRRTIRRTALAGGMVAVAVGGTAAAIKLSQKDVDKIEQHTGKKVEDLSEEELNKAMDDMGIEEQELTDEDVKQIEAGMAKEEAPKTSAAAAPPAAPRAQAQPEEPSYIAELEKLAELKEKGIITEEEFQAKKKQLLGL